MDFSNFLLILCCIGFGMALRRFRVMPDDAHVVLNRFIIYVPLPALILSSIHEMNLGQNAVYPVAMPWILFLTALALFSVVGWLGRNGVGWGKTTVGCLILTAGLGNTSFVGFPLIEAFYGREALSVGVLADEGGTFLVLSTLGILVAAVCSGSKLSLRAAVVVVDFAVRSAIFVGGEAWS
jgi:predicted permease